jgi:hypothetical protein
MNWIPKLKSRAEEPADIEMLDPALKQALGDFKASVRAWSDAAYNQPRTTESVIVRRAWLRSGRLVAGWSLAAMLLAGTVSGGFYAHHQQVIAAQAAAAQKAEQERQAAEQRARDKAQQEDDILASVDTDVSREVPSAMEPLAQLTDEGESR